MTKKLGRKIEQCPVRTDKRSLMVQIMLDVKSSMFWADVDGIHFQNGDINKLKAEIVTRIFELDREVYHPYIAFEVLRRAPSGRGDGFKYSEIGLKTKTLLLTDEREDGERMEKRASYVEGDGRMASALRIDYDKSGYRYHGYERLIPYTEKRYLAMLEIQKTIEALRDKLVEVLSDPDPERLESALDNIPIHRLLGAEDE